MTEKAKNPGNTRIPGPETVPPAPEVPEKKIFILYLYAAYEGPYAVSIFPTLVALTAHAAAHQTYSCNPWEYIEAGYGTEIDFVNGGALVFP